MLFWKVPRYEFRYPKSPLATLLGCAMRRKVVDGEEINTFENALSRYLGVRHVLLTPSGRMAFYLIMKAMGIEPGDEVILPAFTFPAIPNMCHIAGVKSVFVDVNIHTLNIDPSLVEDAISSRTKAVVVNHMFGEPADVGAISDICKKHNIDIIEDCAHALGSEYMGRKTGTFGKASLFSFSMTKNINTLGGGFIATDEDVIIERVKTELSRYKPPNRLELLRRAIKFEYLRMITSKPFFSLLIFPLIRRRRLAEGTNMLDEADSYEHKLMDGLPEECKTRFSNYQAVMGIEQLKRIDDYIDARNRSAALMRKILGQGDMGFQHGLPGSKSALQSFPVMSRNKESLATRLVMSGIDFRETDMRNCAAMGLFGKKACPNAERVEDSIIYLPIFGRHNSSYMRRLRNLVNRT